MEEHNSTHTLLSAQMKNLNVSLLLNLNFYGLKAGADPGFFLGGGALVSCSTSTPINHIVLFFCRIPVVLENCRSSQRGWGGGPPAPSP